MSSFRIELDDRWEAAPPRPRESMDLPSAPSPGADRARADAIRMVRDTDALAEAYRGCPLARGGAYVGGDEVASMVPGVVLHPLEGYAAAEGALGPATIRLVEDRLTAPGHAGQTVLFTMGMQASGKTTLARFAPFASCCHTIIDSPLGHDRAFDSARAMRAMAISSGKAVAFAMVYRPVVAAVAGMLERARPSNEGRPVTLLAMADTLGGSSRTFLRLMDLGATDERTDLFLLWIAPDGTFTRHRGPEAGRILTAELDLVASGLGATLGEVCRSYTAAVREARAAGNPFPPALLTCVETGLPPGFLQAVTEGNAPPLTGSPRGGERIAPTGEGAALAEVHTRIVAGANARADRCRALWGRAAMTREEAFRALGPPTLPAAALAHAKAAGVDVTRFREGNAPYGPGFPDA
jgi:hypothetical protein